MKGNGNGFSTLFRKLYFYCIPTSGKRSRWLKKHKEMFHSFGENVFWQPRTLPSDPELISIGNNVNLASGVQFINHDIIHSMFNKAGYSSECFKPAVGCIEIGDNVMIGANTLILPNVRIGNNVIIAAGSVVTKDCQNDTIQGGGTRKTDRKN